MPQFDFESIAQILANAEPIDAAITADRAFTLACLLQLCLKHPALGENNRTVAESMIRNLQEKLGAIDPRIAEMLELGFDSDNDLTVDEFDRAIANNHVIVHNIYTLYELNQDGSQAEQPLLELSRPQDWGNPDRWHYHRCKISFTLGDRSYTNHCHLWQEVKRNPIEAYQAVAPYLFMVYQPGEYPELCDRSHLEEEDFWEDEWGAMPPVFEGDREDEFDVFDGEDSEFPIATLQTWRVFHPNNWQPDKISAESYTEPPVQEQHQYLIDIEDDQDRFDGYLIVTPTPDQPMLTEYWASRGWQIESKGEMQRFA